MRTSCSPWPETRIHRSVARDTRRCVTCDLPFLARCRRSSISQYVQYGVYVDGWKSESIHRIASRAGLAALFIVSLIVTAKGQTVKIEGLPPDANQVAITVNQGLNSSVAGLFSLPASAPRTFSLHLARGDHYRLRAVAYASGPKFPIISAFGRILDFSVSDNDTELTLSLSPPRVHMDTQNLNGNDGALIEVTCKIEMFSDFWSSNQMFFLWLSDKPLQADAAARHVISTGRAADDGSVSAQFFVVGSLAGGKDYYQCGYPLSEFSPEFATPSLIWPTVRKRANPYRQQEFNGSAASGQ